MLKLIAIAGNARVGKDTMGLYFEEALNSLNVKTKRISFAYALRKSVDDFLIRETGISAFTTDEKEKNIIRPFLVCWGTEVMRRIRPNIWVEKLEENCDPDAVNIITDMRFPNELNWIKTQDAFSVFLHREGIGPANIYEKENNMILATAVDYEFTLANVEDIDILKPLAKNILTLLLSDEDLERWKTTCPL